MSNTFGVSIEFHCLPSSAWEIRRSDIVSAMANLDLDMDKDRFAADAIYARGKHQMWLVEQRYRWMLLGHDLLSHGFKGYEAVEIEAYSDIAYSLLYVWGKPTGFKNIKDIRGLNATWLNNKVQMTPCYFYKGCDRAA